MKARWEVEDGYVGKSRPQSTEIDLREFEEYLDCEEQIRDRIWEIVEDDFNYKISFDIDNMDELVAEIKQKLKELE